ncbi:unnamed protein product [Lupinus luteus]|uniref:RING-type E3 ubiquitin transferase n=1 Tax=Lupinus luteus TaxID=3873 RepID=A0AAV1Y7Q4_LUPLU
MHASTTFTSQYVYELLGDFHYRRLLLQNLNLSSNSATISSHNSTNLYLGGRSFDSNVVMVLSVLLCALICSLGLNSIIRCVLRCSNLAIHIDSSSTSNPPSGLSTTGIKKKALKTFPIVTYSAGLNLPNLDTECVICLSDFTNNDKHM